MFTKRSQNGFLENNFTMNNFSSRFYFIKRPRTKIEIVVLGMYISALLLSYLMFISIVAHWVSVLVFENKVDDYGVEYYFPLLFFYLLNKSVGMYVHFPIIGLFQERIWGISMKMGFPLPFTILNEEVKNIEEILIQNLPSYSVISLEWKNKKRSLAYIWMRNQIIISPFLRNSQELISAVKSKTAGKLRIS